MTARTSSEVRDSFWSAQRRGACLIFRQGLTRMEHTACRAGPDAAARSEAGHPPRIDLRQLEFISARGCNPLFHRDAIRQIAFERDCVVAM
jgi:hypothetical protein